jgi:Cd2+/Zn2+-exporting ATPase
LGAERVKSKVRLLVLRFAVSFALFALGLILLAVANTVPINVVRLLFVASWLLSGYRVLVSAVGNIRKGSVFDENFLMSVATVGAFIVGQWTEGAAVMLFFNLGEIVQESAVAKSRRSIRELMDVRPDTARVELPESVSRETREIHPSLVGTGSVIVVFPGEKVPLDGVVIEGSSSFDTSRLTGESLPRDVAVGSEALAGFVNGSGLIRIRTTVVFSETAASKMLELIENAQNRKAKAERMITSFARVYTPIVTIAAVLLAVVPPLVLAAFGSATATAGAPTLFGWQAFSPWVYRALVFLVISCPCAFVISVPLGFFGGIGGAAKLGILVKGADFIDALAKTRSVVFDKTGTLTKGEFLVLSMECAEGVSPRDLAEYAALAESRSNHPVAVAIRAHAESLGITNQDDSTSPTSPTGLAGDIVDVREVAGFGVSLMRGATRFVAGSRKLMETERVTGYLPAVAQGIVGTFVEIARDGVWSGRLILGDSPKADSSEAIAALAELGIRDVTMITGDSESVARSVASTLGIASYHAGVLPHQKVEIFEEIEARVKKADPKASVLFVGDGINDAPVLTRADAGIAMGGIGSDAAIEAADVVLMNDSPLLVATAIRSARWTRHIVSQNIALAFAIKLGFLALGAIGLASLWEAVFADVGVALLATLNSLRARTLPRKK